MSGEIKKIGESRGLKPDAAYKRLRGDVIDPDFVKCCYDVAIQRANEVLKMKKDLAELRQKIEAL